MDLAYYDKLLAFCEHNKTTLVAVSKTKPIEDIKVFHQRGQRIFGENKVQELVTKYEELPKDIEWHFIGHLQKNKVKYISSFVHLIHGVDSLKLLKEINKRAKQNNRTINCLLQFHIAKEESKFGLKKEEIESITNHLNELENISIKGVMGMATFTADNQIITQEFQKLKFIFNYLKNNFFKNDLGFKELSMGMSGDYKIAIEQGSTMIRIGSSIFGKR